MNRCRRCDNLCSACEAEVFKTSKPAKSDDLSDRTKHIPIDEIDTASRSTMLLIDAPDRAAIQACRNLPTAFLEAEGVEMMVEYFQLKDGTLRIGGTTYRKENKMVISRMKELAKEIIKLLEVK